MNTARPAAAPWPMPVILALLLGVSGARAAPPVVALPFVGCASDGQQGPQRPPAAGPTPRIAPADAARLAFYAMDGGPRVIAPRGWRCFGRYGSNGSVLIVAPDARAWAVGARYRGPAVVRETTFGGTSGRFEVAAFAARMFPVAAPRVAEVEAEGIADRFPRGIPAGDRVTRRGAYEVLYTTPAGRPGIGTRGGLAPGPLPVDGIGILRRDADGDLETMDARLPAPLRPLVAHIIADAARDGRAGGVR